MRSIDREGRLTRRGTAGLKGGPAARIAILVLACAAQAGVAVFAAGQPDLVNYQGVLRDASGNPRNGSFDITFRLFNAASGGSAILSDAHLASGGQAIVVTGGLFTASIGSGAITDGPGPGAYTSLALVFRDFSDVWLEIQVGAETLAPRVRVLSTPWALEAGDAGTLGGRPGSAFLDTSAGAQAKSGTLVVGAAVSATGGTYGLEGWGTSGGGYFRDVNGTGTVLAGTGDDGIDAFGNGYGGRFYNTATGEEAAVAGNGRGLWAMGSLSAALFENTDPTGGTLFVATPEFGLNAHGPMGGGSFHQTDGTSSVYLAYGSMGIIASGTFRGGGFRDLDGSGEALLAEGDRGMIGRGNETGGYFEDAQATSHAYLGYGNRGIEATGNATGGYFSSSNSDGYAYVGDTGYGIRGFGTTAGGYFDDTNGTGLAYAGFGDFGVQGFGSFAGGYFKCNATGNTGEVWLGDHNRGLWAKGSDFGGIFQDTNGTGQATLAIGNTGLTATGSFEGVNVSGGNWAGYFTDSNDGSEVYLAYGPQGIQARGATYGGNFVDTDSGSQASVGFSTYKIQGTGAVSFVQNHPEDPQRVIVYHAPEASEVAVYTRGRGRLVAGEARIPLDPTFAWVANPDIGLTAQLTPRGISCVLHIAALTTAELLAGSGDPACGDAEFDYMVWGLRIGFEELPPVQPKQHDAPVPSMAEHRALYRTEPAMRAYAAGSRFEATAASLSSGLSSSDAAPIAAHAKAADLLARIGEYDPAAHAAEVAGSGARGIDRSIELERPPEPSAVPATPSPRPQPLVVPPDDSIAPAPAGCATVGAGLRPVEAGSRPSGPEVQVLPIGGEVAAGDVLALDPDRPGRLRRAASIADPQVVGVAMGEPDAGEDSGGPAVQVVGAGFARVNADAGFGAIRPGDLLVSSPHPGHAMRAVAAEPGTVLGKALEGLEAGTGLIRILLMPR